MFFESILASVQEISAVEIAAVFTSIAYAWLASKNNIWCWLFGILSPVLTMYALYFYFQLYAEVYLQVYYIAMSIYGFYTWKFGKQNEDVTDQEIVGSNEQGKAITMWPLKRHLLFIASGFVLTFILGTLLKNYTEAASTYIDSFTTIFAVLATFMTARRILENWIYWIIIDSISIFLYFDRGGYLFALLFIAYTLIAVYGFIHWRKEFRVSHA